MNELEKLLTIINKSTSKEKLIEKTEIIKAQMISEFDKEIVEIDLILKAK